MAASPLTRPSDPVVLPSHRIAILQSLLTVAARKVEAEFEAFATRLCEALLKHAEQSERAGRRDEADVLRKALQQLSGNRTTLRRLLAASLPDVLCEQLRAIAEPGKPKLEREAIDLSLVSFEAMEQKVLIDNLSQKLDVAYAEELGALSLRLACLLGREEVPPAHNPFRSETYLRAVAEAWSQFELGGSSLRPMLHHLQPEVFLDLRPVLNALNQTLISHDILPKLVYRVKKAAESASQCEKSMRRQLPIYSRLTRWLSPADPAALDAEVEISPALVDYLTTLQKTGPRLSSATASTAAPADASVLREVRRQAPQGSLSKIDENAIELLARMFDFVFHEQHIPGDFKKLIGQLQIPVLKAALADKDFFFWDQHPARRLVEIVAQAGVAWNQEQGYEDPLFQSVEQVIERVQEEYEQQIELFTEAVLELQTVLAREEETADPLLARAIENALTQERISRAKELAANDVAMRIETGEVSRFVETFLETQWVRILGLGHTIRETKPEVLNSSLRTMDELIWSVKPKTTQQERKELLGKLPSLLAALNASLDVVKWQGPEREQFFSTLAERHAAIMRAPLELTPGQQLEITINIAERLADRRFNKRAVERPDTVIDEFVHLADRLEAGAWIEFRRTAGTRAKYRLAWVSPGRSRFVFAGRGAQEPFTLSFDELVQSFRDGTARQLVADVVMDRALSAVLEGLEA